VAAGGLADTGQHAVDHPAVERRQQAVALRNRQKASGDTSVPSSPRMRSSTSAEV